MINKTKKSPVSAKGKAAVKKTASKVKEIASTLNIVMMDIKDIKPYWRNPRINVGTVPALVKSIKRFGFNAPLIVDSKGVIVVGHARYKALTMLGITEVPCIVSELTPDKNKEYRIMDNKVQEHSEWDSELLASELKDSLQYSDLEAFFAGTLSRVLDFTAMKVELGIEDVAVEVELEQEEEPVLEVKKYVQSKEATGEPEAYEDDDSSAINFTDEDNQEEFEGGGDEDLNPEQNIDDDSLPVSKNQKKPTPKKDVSITVIEEVEEEQPFEYKARCPYCKCGISVDDIID